MATNMDIVDEFVKPVLEAREAQFEYRLMRPRDEAQLKPLMWEFLQANYERGGEMIPNEKNVELMVAIALKHAEQAQPCLVATVPNPGWIDRRIIAYVTWAEVESPFDSRWPKTMNAYGTYTVPEYRSQGIAAKLRRKAFAMAKAMGIQRIVGPVHAVNKRGMEEFERAWGAGISTHIYELFIEENNDETN